MNTEVIERPYSVAVLIVTLIFIADIKIKVKASHTRHRALGPELIPLYRQSACR